MESDRALVRVEVADGVAVLTLDRPPLNAFDLSLGIALQAAIREVSDRADVGALVITGGPRVFAAGADIKAMATWGPDEVKPSVDALGEACDLLEALPQVSIAAVNGYALGGGLELALACDLRYLAHDAQVGQPEIQLGVIPGAGGTQRLVPLIGLARTRDLVYTGRRIDAAEALSIGLADRLVAPEDVLEAAVGSARGFANGPRKALAAAKTAIRAAVLTPGAAGVAEERALFLQLFGTADQREGMAAFLEKRPASFT
jgi:enoyl-CoA hydratase/carnithine racemase